MKELTPRGWMSFVSGIIGIVFIPMFFASCALVIGLFTWKESNLGKIGAILGSLEILYIILGYIGIV